MNMLSAEPGAVIEVLCDKKSIGSYTISDNDVSKAQYPEMPLKSFPEKWQEVRFPVQIPAGRHRLAFQIRNAKADMMLRDFRFVE